ncbi:MAG: preprotein translocase subunit YajC [Bacteriovoracaceae bacterium]
MFNLINSAYAQTAPAAQPNAMMQLVPLLLIGVVFYFFMIRPQAKKLKDEQAFLNTLAKGEEIFTKSGIIGTIVGLTDKIVTLEISEGVKLKILKSQIAGQAKKLLESPETAK